MTTQLQCAFYSKTLGRSALIMFYLSSHKINRKIEDREICDISESDTSLVHFSPAHLPPVLVGVICDLNSVARPGGKTWCHQISIKATLVRYQYMHSNFNIFCVVNVGVIVFLHIWCHTTLSSFLHLQSWHTKLFYVTYSTQLFVLCYPLRRQMVL